MPRVIQVSPQVNTDPLAATSEETSASVSPITTQRHDAAEKTLLAESPSCHAENAENITTNAMIPAAVNDEPIGITNDGDFPLVSINTDGEDMEGKQSEFSGVATSSNENSTAAHDLFRESSHDDVVIEGGGVSQMNEVQEPLETRESAEYLIENGSVLSNQSNNDQYAETVGAAGAYETSADDYGINGISDIKNVIKNMNFIGMDSLNVLDGSTEFSASGEKRKMDGQEEGRKRKRKKQEEFTVFQKLEILKELDGHVATTVPLLAEKYNTSKSSIHRWKKNKRRLVRLAANEGKGLYKRASLKRKKCYNEEYTASEKLSLLKTLKHDPRSIKEVARSHGIHERSLYRWRKEEEKISRVVEMEGKGERKRISEDPLQRIKDEIGLFCRQNSMSDEPLKINGPMIALKARKLKEEFLNEHSINPFLSDEEAKAMREFIASDSWGRKLINKLGLGKKGAGSTQFEAAASNRVENPSSQNKSTTATGTTTRATTVTISSKQKSQMQLLIMKGEMSSLRKRVKVADDKVTKLEDENLALKREILSLRSRLMQSQNPPAVTGLVIPLGVYPLEGEPTAPQTIEDKNEASDAVFEENVAAQLKEPVNNT